MLPCRDRYVDVCNVCRHFSLQMCVCHNVMTDVPMCVHISQLLKLFFEHKTQKSRPLPTLRRCRKPPTHPTMSIYLSERCSRGYAICMFAMWALSSVLIMTCPLRQVFANEKQPKPQVDDATRLQQIEDGCGLEENLGNIHWRNYTKEDWEMYYRIETCVKWYDSNYIDTYDSANFRKLACNQEPDLTSILSALQKYHTIYILGDSVLQQQFIALMCTIDPMHPNVDPIGKMDVHKKDWYFFNYTHARGVTQFKFFKVGFFFDNEQKGFLQTHFPTAIEASTANDAIILHVGAHYRSGNAHHMKTAVEYFANRSVDTLASIFVVEPNIEEFHTRNGLFAPTPNDNRTDCQPLTPERMLGRGQLAPNVPFNKKDELPPLPLSVFQDLYPGKEYDSVRENATYQCYPDCAPQKWRLDLVRKFLSGSKVHIVPVWWQMAALNLQHGIVQARKPCDCIHKDISSLISMNNQLIRTMMSTQ